MHVKSLQKNARTFSLLHVTIFFFNFIVAHEITTRTRISSKHNMDNYHKHVFEWLLSNNGPVAINVVENRDPSPTTHVIIYVQLNGIGVGRKSRTKGIRGPKMRPVCGRNARALNTASAKTSGAKDSDPRSACARRRTAYYAFRTDRCCLRRLLRCLIGLVLPYKTT